MFFFDDLKMIFFQTIRAAHLWFHAMCVVLIWKSKVFNFSFYFYCRFFFFFWINVLNICFWFSFLSSVFVFFFHTRDAIVFLFFRTNFSNRFGFVLIVVVQYFCLVGCSAAEFFYIRDGNAEDDQVKIRTEH